MASIGVRILDLIKRKGMTQKEFSEKTGIPQSTISDWKGKGINPNSDKIMAISNVLEVSVEDLLSGETKGNNRGINYICVDKDSPEYGIIIEYRKLDSCNKARLEGYLKALSENFR